MTNPSIATVTSIKAASTALLEAWATQKTFTAKTPTAVRTQVSQKAAQALAALNTGAKTVVAAQSATPTPTPTPAPVPTPTPVQVPQPTPVPTTPANSTTVSDSAGLIAAMKAAGPGQTILVAPGRYDGLRFDQIKAMGVTVTSADRANPAVLSGFYLTNSNGVRFSNLIFTVEGSSDPYPFRTNYSANITFENLLVRGAPGGNPQDQQTGLWVANTTGLIIRNSELTKLVNGITHSGNTGVLIDGNRIHEIGTDGIDNGGDCTDVTISNNWLSDFHPVDGQHPDAIQFWTANASGPTTKVSVIGNLIERGAGGIMQGLFMGNEKGIPYSDVGVSGNTVLGAMYNGVAVGVADKVTISGNHLEAFADQDSWVVLRSVTNATVLNNAAQMFNYTDTTPIQANNRLNGVSSDQGAAAIAAWKAAHPTFAAGLLAP